VARSTLFPYTTLFRSQNVLTAFEIGGVLLVAIAGLSLIATPALPAETVAATPQIGAFGLAMVFVLLTFGGWNEAAYVSAEVRGRSEEHTSELQSRENL